MKNLKAEKLQSKEVFGENNKIEISNSTYDFFLKMYYDMFPYQRFAFEPSEDLRKYERARFSERYYVRFDMNIFGLYKLNKNLFHKERMTTIARTLKKGILESMKKTMHPSNPQKEEES